MSVLCLPVESGYISTAMSNKLQAEFHIAPATEEGKNAAQLFFLRCLHSERSGFQVPPVPEKQTVTPFSPEICCSTSLFCHYI
jgi:hypothetical protein